MNSVNAFLKFRSGIFVVNGILFLSILFYSVMVFAYSSGMTGVTKKNGNGCTCHGPSPTASVIVTISGPDTIKVNQAANYTLTIQGGPAVRGGTDIAASTGVLAAGSSALQKVGDELTQVQPVAFSGGSVSFPFAYTAPTAPGVITIYANGNSVNFNGGSSGDQWNFAPDKKVTVIAQTTSIENEGAAPQSFFLSQNYPNPFNPSTTIEFMLPSSGQVSLKVFSVQGKEVATVLHGELTAGRHVVQFNASNLPSGIYLYQLTAGSMVQQRKMMSLK